MYERFYNLRERPFALSPDPEYLYLSKAHSEALDSIRYGIESRAGFTVVTGEIGAGKTTLLQSVLQRLDDRTVIARVVNTMLEPRELLEAIALDFGLADVSKSKPVLVRDLGMFLVEQRRQGRRPLLVIDEAQNLSPQSLEEVRLLSNLETEKSKLLQILLAGQPNLRDTIASPQLEQFRQRIAVSYHLLPLAPAETAAYINFRLEHAALGEPLRFPADASALVHDVSKGIPRIINVVCDAALVFGYAEERRTIDRAMIDEVIDELEETGIVRRATVSEEATPASAIAANESAVNNPSMPATNPPVQPVPEPKVTAEVSATSDNFWRPVTPVPSPAAVQPTAAAIPAAAMSDTQWSRDRALAAAREAAVQATELASSREELATQRESVARRLRELALREQALVERERQIGEQRRIMNEEYRLLRQTQPARSVAAPAARLPISLNRPESSETNRHSLLTIWQRVSRLFGSGHAVRS